MKEVLRVQDLKVEFRTQGEVFHAVDDLSLSIGEGETLCLVGESGCGKSMTALSIMRLVPMPAGKITQGSIHLQGLDLLRLSESEMRSMRGQEIGMIFQEPMTSLDTVFHVGKQIAEGIILHEKVSHSEARKRAVDAMREVGIPSPEERFDQYPHQMSGGMRQRIMIAMALALKPRLLLADEPTTALDVTIQAQILALIKEIQKKHGMSVLLITHDLGVVAQVADRVAIMYAGHIVEMGQVRDVLEKPMHPYTERLYASIPKGDKSTKLETIEGRVPSLNHLPKYCRFFDRCPKAAADCKVSLPELLEYEEGHWARCIKVGAE